MKNQPLVAQLARRQRTSDEWLPWFAARLPDGLSGRLAQVTCQGGTLRLTCASAAWGARLRYALGPLEAEIRDRDPDIVKIVVAVMPARAGNRT